MTSPTLGQPLGQPLGVPPSDTIWAYSYEIIPPQPEVRLRAIKTLLEKEHAVASGGARKWEARLLVEHEVTHILVVSDSPDQDREVNRRLEAALRQLDAAYSLTVPLAVPEAPPVPAGARSPRSDRRKSRR